MLISWFQRILVLTEICQKIIKTDCYNNISMKISSTIVHEMKGSQFPFGLLNEDLVDSKKVLIKKRINYKNQVEYEKLKEKIDKLKCISHKNTINLRSTEDLKNGHIDLFYPYVPIPLEESFNENYNQTVKEMHKQFIELAIYLAKHYILTSFNPARCGVIINENKTIIKYFLPLNEIMITDNISMLERSVQIFNVQSMHYLDILTQNALNKSMSNLSSQQSISGSHILLDQNRKIRKESQPTTLQFKSQRKLSVNPLSRQMRKFSHLSKELSEFSEMRKKRTKQSTNISSGSFNTMRQLLKYQSSRDLFKSYLSQTKTIRDRVQILRQRSIAAIKSFSQLRVLMEKHRSASILINMIRS